MLMNWQRTLSTRQRLGNHQKMTKLKGRRLKKARTRRR